MSFIARNMLMHLLKTHNIKLIGNSVVERFTDKGVEVIDNKFRRATYEADTIVTAFVMKANDEMIEQFSSIVPETYAVGDCGGVSNIYTANHSAFNYAVEV
jgi:hypothetical protein